jgi:hypothetical protein
VASFCEYDDLVQDAWYYFLRVRKYYVERLSALEESRIKRNNRRTRKINYPKWFFGIYQIAFRRHFARLKQRSEKAAVMISTVQRVTDAGVESVDLLNYVGQDGFQELVVLLNECGYSASYIARQLLGTSNVYRRALGYDPVTGRVRRRAGLLRV